MLRATRMLAALILGDIQIIQHWRKFSPGTAFAKTVRKESYKSHPKSRQRKSRDLVDPRIPRCQ